MTEAVRTMTGDHELIARGPWVNVYVLPQLNGGINRHVPNWDAWREYFAADTPQEAEEIFRKLTASPAAS